MFIKRNVRLFSLTVKKMWIGFFLPILLCVLTPIKAYMECYSLSYLSLSERYLRTLNFYQIVVPILTCIFCITLMQEWKKSEQKELYSSIKAMPILISIIFIIIWEICLALSVLGCNISLNGFYYEVFRIICISLYFQGIFLIAWDYVNNEIICFGGIILYIYLAMQENIPTWMNYKIGFPLNRAYDYTRCWYFACLGVTSTILTFVAFRKKEKYTRKH